MPAGNISAVERHHRIAKVKELNSEGKTTQQIVEATGMSLTTVKRNLRYSKEIDVGDLTPADVNKKRVEIEAELLETIDEASSMFESFKDDKKKWTAARAWHQRWTESLSLWMKLFGLDSMKIEAFNLINNQNNYVESDHGLSKAAIEKIADVIESEA